MNSHVLFDLIFTHEAELRERDARRAALVRLATPETAGNSPGVIRRWIADLLVRTGEPSGTELTRRQSRFRVFTKASLMPLLCGLATGVKQGTRLSLRSEDAGFAGCVDRAVVREPLHRMRAR